MISVWLIDNLKAGAWDAEQAPKSIFQFVYTIHIDWRDWFISIFATRFQICRRIVLLLIFIHDIFNKECKILTENKTSHWKESVYESVE